MADVRTEIRAILDSPGFKHAARLGSLLQYVCNKTLLDQADEVSEYTIAMDVFGKPESFKESKNSNVRVEVHRLRKRLIQFYENEGADRPLQIIIPPGRYTPDFIAKSDLATAEPEYALALPEPDREFGSGLHTEPAALIQPFNPPVEPSVESPVESKISRPRRTYALVPTGALALLAILALGLTWQRSLKTGSRAGTAAPSTPTQTRATAALAATPAGTGFAIVPVRILAGYTGPSRTDATGAVWGADRYFVRGRPGERNRVRVGRTNNPILFENSRIGDFSYDIPLKPGSYELHLYFVEPELADETGRGENDRTFFLHVNDKRFIPAIDVVSDAMGANIAHERVFKDVGPGPNGMLHIEFESGTGVPFLNALEVLPGLPHHQLPVRIVAHPAPYTDHDGNVWQPDNYYLHGRSFARNLPVAGTGDPGLYSVERYGHFTYAIPVDVSGRYAVTLHFAEFFFGRTPEFPGPGSRVFNVFCNGARLIEDLDVFKEVGLGHALVRTFHNLKPTAQGKLNLTFEPVMNYALVNAIEVTDESPER